MRLFLLLALSAILWSPEVSAQTKILAQVNDDIISELDFERRLEFIKITGQADIKKKAVRDQIMKQLIDEKLKQQEARRAGVSVSEEEIRNAVKVTLEQNGMSYDTAAKTLKEHGLPMSVIDEQIKSDLLYIRAIRKNAGARGEVSDREVDARLQEIEGMMGEKQYLLSEIVLPIPSEDKADAVYGEAMKLVMRMRGGESFEELAEKYSKAATAANGGLVGWVSEDKMTEEVKEEVSVMQPGQVSTPVKTPEGYKLFALRTVREPEHAGEQEIVRLAQMFIPETFSAQKRASVLRELNMTRGSCTQFISVAEQLKTTPRIDLGAVPVKDLPDPIARLLAKTPLLTPAAPLKIDGGELIIMTCSRETASSLPDREEIKMQLEARRLETIAQRRLRDLRREAVTEIRR